jgi:hypothetical protein
MRNERWGLKIVVDRIEVRSADGALATLAYPTKTPNSSHVKRVAYLMVTAPTLFDAVKALSQQLKAVIWLSSKVRLAAATRPS